MRHTTGTVCQLCVTRKRGLIGDHLFLAAHELLAAPCYRELAERSVWTAWEHHDPSADLCCGLGGRAYGLLALYQVTGAPAWLGRARELAVNAALGIRDSSLARDSLYRGEPGIAVLAAELARPECAAMPLFAPEGGATQGDPRRIFVRKVQEFKD